MVDFVSTNPEQDSRKSSKTYKRYPIHAFFFPLSNSGLWVGLGDPPGQVLGYYRVNTLTIVHAHIYISSQFTVKSPNPLNCGKKLEYLPKNMQTLGRLANAIEKAQTQNILALKWQCWPLLSKVFWKVTSAKHEMEVMHKNATPILIIVVPVGLIA